MLLPEGAGKQCLWMVSGVAFNFFSTTVGKRARKTLKANHAIAADYHRKLWPGMMVPEIEPTPGGSQFMEESMPTSLVVAYMAAMIGNDKRKKQYRQRAYEWLKAIIERLSVFHPTLVFMWSNIDGEVAWVQQELTSPTSCMPWARPFFDQYLQMCWHDDLASSNKPWVSTYPQEGSIHLADYLAFSLDTPSWLSKKANRETQWAKQIIERSALNILTQLASHLENYIQQLTEPLGESVGKDKKLDRVTKWALVAQAMDLVFSQQETWNMLSQCVFSFFVSFLGSNRVAILKHETTIGLADMECFVTTKSVDQGKVLKAGIESSWWQEN